MRNMDEDFESDRLRRGSFEDRFGDRNFREDRPRPRDSLIQPERNEPPKKEASKKKGKNFVELLTGGEDIGVFARQMNLDPEMAERVLVPLLSLLEKYEVGTTVTANPRVESAMNAFEVIRDVAPVVRGAAEFISGRKAELEADDLAYLEAIRQSKNVSDAGLFDDDDEDLFLMSEPEPEPVVQKPVAPTKPAPNFTSFGANDWGAFFSEQAGGVPKDPLDNQVTRELEATQNAVNAWASEQSAEIKAKKGQSGVFTAPNQVGTTEDFDMTSGLPSTFTDMMATEFAIVDVSALAKESGLSVSEVLGADSQKKINGDDESFDDEPFDLTEFQPDEEAFEADYAQVPENAEDYDPFTVAGFDIPQFSADEEDA